MADFDANVSTPSAAGAVVHAPRVGAGTGGASTVAAVVHAPRVGAEVHGAPGSGPVTHFLMTALRVSDSTWITWPVTGTPDVTGALAPEAVTLATIAVVRRWTT